MSKVVNKLVAGRKVTASFGVMEFDENGVAEVPEEMAKKLVEISGFYVEGLSEKAQAETVEPQVEVKEEVVEAEEKQEEADLSKLNVPQLKKYAKDNGIDLGGASKKDEILAAIKSAQ